MWTSQCLSTQGATSLVGKQLVARKHDWSKLDEYASYLHEQDRENCRVIIRLRSSRCRKEMRKTIVRRLSLVFPGSTLKSSLKHPRAADFFEDVGKLSKVHVVHVLEFSGFPHQSCGFAPGCASTKVGCSGIPNSWIHQICRRRMM